MGLRSVLCAVDNGVGDWKSRSPWMGAAYCVEYYSFLSSHADFIREGLLYSSQVYVKLVGLGEGKRFISYSWHGILGLMRVSSVQVYREFLGNILGSAVTEMNV